MEAEAGLCQFFAHVADLGIAVGAANPGLVGELERPAVPPSRPLSGDVDRYGRTNALLADLAVGFADQMIENGNVERGGERATHDRRLGPADLGGHQLHAGNPDPQGLAGIEPVARPNQPEAAFGKILHPHPRPGLEPLADIADQRDRCTAPCTAVDFGVGRGSIGAGKCGVIHSVVYPLASNRFDVGRETRKEEFTGSNQCEPLWSENGGLNGGWPEYCLAAEGTYPGWTRMLWRTGWD